MTFEVTTTGSHQHMNLSTMVVGPPGIGKTPFAMTSPKPFLINAEAGVASVAHLKANMARIEDTKTLLEIRNVLALEEDERNEVLGFEVETVVLDTIDEIQRIMIHERLEATRKAEMGPGDWGWLADEMNAIARGFRGLDMNVIFVCHTKAIQEGETGQIRYVPDMSGAFGHQLPAIVDVVARIQRAEILDEDDGVAVTHHYFVSGYDRHYDWLKNRGMLPNSIELNFVDDFKRIHDQYFDGVVITDTDVRTVGTVVDREDPAEEEASEITVEEARDKIDKAAAVMAEATAAKEKEKAKEKSSDAPVLTEPSKTKPSIDLSGYNNGDRVVSDEFPTAGFSLKDDPKNELQTARRTRFFYRLEDGTEILSVNELEPGVMPIPNPEIDTSIFCQFTGEEVTKHQASVSRVKHRKVMSPAKFGNMDNS